MSIISLSQIAPDGDPPSLLSPDKGLPGNMHDVDAAHGGGAPNRLSTFAESAYVQGGGCDLSPPWDIACGEKR